MNDENEIDDLFKSRFTNPENEPSFDEKDWQGMEDLLDGRSRRRGIIYWLPAVGVAAAVLLLLGGWWLFKSRKDTGVGHGPALTHNVHQQNSGTNGGAKRLPGGSGREAQAPVSIAQNARQGNADSGQKSFLSPSAAGARRVAGSIAIAVDTAAPVLQRKELAALYLHQNTTISQVALPASDLQPIPYTTLDAVRHDTTPAKKTPIHVKSPYRPQYALTVWAAPDMNSTGGFQQSQLGDNVGVLFSAGVTKRLTISTGALYSNKPYLTSFADYHTNYQFPVSPQSVYTDCKMFDIPINAAYTLYSKHRNTFSLGTGLSSYIMLHQDYTFNYANPYTPGPSSYNAPGIGKYYFGILNLNATYERRLNSRVGFSIQPYYKLPLSNVGYSQVRLQSTGIAAGLTWNFSQPLKP